MRTTTLNNLDSFLYWSLGKRAIAYPLAAHEELLSPPLPALETFERDYGYFSLKPLVGEVSSQREDLLVATQTLASVAALTGASLQLAAAELLTKVIAYRDLQVGDTLNLLYPTAKGASEETFTVDVIFNIWHGMPAFGLTSATTSLLLFRGTDFSLITKRSLASIFSDLNLSGPGLKAFRSAQEALHTWLVRVHSQGKSAQVMGFSLGGALAAYTFIYEHAWLSPEPSFSLCAPGINAPTLHDFLLLPHPTQHRFISYINAGDLVPTIGSLFGTVYCLRPATPLKPIAAHTALFCALPLVHKARLPTSALLKPP